MGVEMSGGGSKGILRVCGMGMGVGVRVRRGVRVMGLGLMRKG